MHLYQLKITLRHIRPPVWRRLVVPADIKLPKLHEVLQAAMGWTNSHLHAFRVNGVTYGEPDPDFDAGMKSERGVRLDSVAGEGGSLIYDYDFGDGWEHDIKVEAAIPAETDTPRYLCTAGERTCPPEDCGGPPGYMELLEALRDRKHPQHADMLEWMGGEFDPEAFDLDAVNSALRGIR